ncbi:hypothetical protein J2848_005982 [Azospirillum lipoferum]|nr:MULTISPECIES: hypothetical protein [Azospirillum]MCP1614279.1 hypothetical protein [Azospirillum lipoferum]MDW5531939.1 hypothetical protein [Azospirillum sp. NL1]
MNVKFLKRCRTGLLTPTDIEGFENIALNGNDHNTGAAKCALTGISTY